MSVPMRKDEPEFAEDLTTADLAQGKRPAVSEDRPQSSSCRAFGRDRAARSAKCYQRCSQRLGPKYAGCNTAFPEQRIGKPAQPVE